MSLFRNSRFCTSSQDLSVLLGSRRCYSGSPLLPRSRCRSKWTPTTSFEILGATFWHDDLQKEILRKLESGYYDAVIASPPCGTWSRAPWANDQGPRPLRSSVHPYGFPWLEGWKLLKVTQSNSMVELSLQAFTICMKQDILFLFEHPEDLGSTTRYSSDMRPASVWQLLPIPQLGGGWRGLQWCSLPMLFWCLFT